MPLSEREQRLLDQIERARHAEDPELSSTLRGDGRYESGRSRSARGTAVVLHVLGGGITSFSSTGVFPRLSVIGLLVAFGGAAPAVASWGAAREVGRC